VPSGGVDILAGYVADLKNKNPNTVVVSAGDLIGASPLISISGKVVSVTANNIVVDRTIQAITPDAIIADIVAQ